MRSLSLVVGAAVVMATACTSSSASPKPSPSPSSTPTATVFATKLCFVSPPSDWQDAMSNLVTSLDGVTFVPEAVDDHDGIVFAESLTPSQGHVVAMDLSTAKVTELAAGPSTGIPWMSFADGWLAWPQVGLGGASIQLWNATTHERRQIATSGPPGTAAIGNGYVAWNEAATDYTDAIRVYRFATGDTVTLDSGHVYSPVFAAGFLVWIKQPGSGPPSPTTSLTPPPQSSFVFADATTLQPVAAPAELRQAREIDFLAGSPGKLLWNDRSAWFVDDLAIGLIRSYTTTPDHYLQFPELAEPYLAWLGPDRDSIIDLRTGIGFDVPRPGGMAAAGDTIVVNKVSTLNKGSVSRTDISVLHPSQLSHLGPCTA